MIRQNELMPLRHQAAMQKSATIAPELTQKVNHAGHTIGPTKDSKGALYFMVLKKVNTYYLRILHYTGSLKRKSVTCR